MIMGLFKPSWMCKTRGKALAAVSKLTKQSEITRAAQNAPDKVVRMHAVCMLTDQKALAAIGSDENEKYVSVRYAAIDRLSDRSLAEKLYTKIAVETNGLSEQAIEKMTDETLMAEIAKAIHRIDTRDAILKRIASQELLADIARNAKCDHVRAKAAGMLTDNRLAQEMFAGIAMSGWHDDSLREVLAAIKDRDLVEKVAGAAEDSRVLLAMAEKLPDERLAQKTYAKLVANAAKHIGYHDKRDVKDALQKINDQELLADIAENDGQYHDICKLALEKVSDEKLLHRVSQNAVHWKTRMYAAKKLADPASQQEVYAHIAQNHENKYARKEAIQQITDKMVLSLIVSSGEEYRYEWTESTEVYDYTMPSTYTGAHDGYDVYKTVTQNHVLDLRDTAQKRLNELETDGAGI